MDIILFFNGLTFSYSKYNIFQGWIYLENKISKNQWKISETIYTHFQKVPIYTFIDHVLQIL